MKRYIRTKDGKIIDSTKPIEQAFTKNGRGGFRIMPNIKGAVKQADTIEELIKVGDLIKAKYKNVYGVLEEGAVEVLSMEHFSKGYINKICMIIEITELYTKQGRNYVLV